MDVARRVGLVLIALVAAFVWFRMEPKVPSVGLTGIRANQLLDLALSDYEANDALTDSAPQQQVVNGWVARDLLQILATVEAAELDAITQSASTSDDRVPALLALGVVAICWSGVFSSITVPAVAAASRSINPGTEDHQS